MKPSRSLFFCGSLLFCLISFSGRASAEISYRSMTFKPYLEFSRSHDSNIYLKSVQEQAASVSLLRFGSDMFLPIREHSVALHYYGDGTLYSERPDENNTVEHNIGTEIRLNFPSGLLFRLKDTFSSAADPAPDEFSEPVKRTQNDFLYAAGVKWPSGFLTRATYEQKYLDYLNDEYKFELSRRESRVGMETEYAVSPKTAVYGAYQYGFIDYMYASPNNSYSHFLGGGMRGKLTYKTSLEAEAGIKARSYRTDSVNDVTSPVIAFSAVTAFSERTRFKLDLYRDTRESNFTDNPYYMMDYAGAEIKQVLFRDITVGLKGHYVIDTFPNAVPVGSGSKKRNDTRYYAGFSCEFPVMGWLSLNESYLYGVRDSNIDYYDYTDHYISLSVRAKY